MRVLITRPEPGAGATAREVAALGHEVIVFPLSVVRPLQPGQGFGTGTIAAVAVTSANAMRHAPEALLAALRRKPCFAVGPATTEAAREAGFADIRTGGPDGAALAGQIAASLPTGSVVAYLCGRPRRPEFEAGIAAAGLKVGAVEVYEAVPVEAGEEDLARVANGAIDAAPVYSPEGARLLAGLVAQAPGFFERTQFLCLSEAVGKALAGVLAERKRIAERPDAAAMLRLMRGL